MRWREMEGGGKWKEMGWDEKKWRRWDEMRWREIEGDEMRREEMEGGEKRWEEKKWKEMRREKMEMRCEDMEGKMRRNEGRELTNAILIGPMTNWVCKTETKYHLLAVPTAAQRDDLRSIWIAEIEVKAWSLACVSTTCPGGKIW